MRDEFVRQIKEEMSQIHIELSDGQVKKFYRFYELLIEWNTMINLTAITKMEEVITKHFVDSLTLVKAIDELQQKGCSLIDVGTGAGFPGIPLKIVYPDLQVTLLDSLNKRVKFLNEVIGFLELEKIEAVHGRAEDIARNVSRETYDICVSRAVANLATLSEYCLPFVKKDGLFVAYKSERAAEELEASRGAIKKLCGEIEDTIIFQLPNTDERTLVKIRKTGVMSKKYPRKAGLPAKEPLK